MRAPGKTWRYAGWLSVAPLAWLGGVALQLQQRSLDAVWVYVATLAGGACLGLAAARLRRLMTVPLVLALVAVAGPLLAGFGLAGWQATQSASDPLPSALEGEDLVVTGIVASLPQRGPSGLRFRFALDDASRDRPGGRLPAAIALGWYAGSHEDAALQQPLRELRAGQRWRLTVRLRQPHGSLNPHGFDYELLLFEQGLRATGYVRNAPTLMLAESAGVPVERMRQRVRDAIEAHVADRRAAGVLAALAVGDQSAIERDDWDLFRNTGVAHLMSISGLHVTMFAWLAGLAVAAIWRRSDRALLLVPAPTVGRWGGLAAALAYAVFSGWGVPSQRTVWMLAAVTTLQSAGLRWPWPLVLLMAAALVSGIDPWALLQPGFWLSFMAVGLLMASSGPAGADEPAEARSGAAEAAEPAAATTGWRRWPASLMATMRAGLRTQVLATLGLTPLTLVFFQQVSLVGFFANVVAIPLVTLVITPLALLGAAVAPLWRAGAWVVTALDAWLGRLAAIPGAVWVLPAAPAWAQLLGLLGAVVMVLPLPWRARLLALPLTLGLFVPPRSLPAEGDFEMVAADVGQGMAVLIRTRAHVLLFDTGPQYSRESDAGQRVLVPLLRARGDEHVDRLVLSHRDLDHVGGAHAVLSSLTVDEVSSSLEATHPLLAEAHRSVRCQAGQRWTWDGVDFVVLRPQADDYARLLKSNAMSCVVRVAGRTQSALLAGDIESEQEAALVAAHGAALRSDVLLAPHHGSKTSSTPAFLDAVAPTVAVFQAGYRNRFGHPAAEVLARYRERGIAIAASPACGAWLWAEKGEGVSSVGARARSSEDAGAGSTAGKIGSCWRETARRYWHHRPASADG